MTGWQVETERHFSPFATAWLYASQLYVSLPLPATFKECERHQLEAAQHRGLPLLYLYLH